MDSLIAASARALAAGDALGALKRVALRSDPPALALRGIAMAQLGEHPRARELLRQAVRGFGAHEALASARCVVAEAEVALAMRDIAGSTRALEAAATTLDAHGDRANAMHARLIAARRQLLLGQLESARASLQHASEATPDSRGMPAALTAVAALTTAELAMRSLKTAATTEALVRAHDAALRAGVPQLLAEVEEARAALVRPAARLIAASEEKTLRLEEVEALLDSGALVLDACRRQLCAGSQTISLARRPILFALARQLAEAWPGDADRDALIACAFRMREADETHRARLRVEIGRLRSLVKGIAKIEATPRGFALKPMNPPAAPVSVIAPPIDGEAGALVALLADGAAWSTSALAQAMGESQRTVQRALAELEAAAQVRAVGQARARRWVAPPLAAFTTILLLPASLPPA